MTQAELNREVARALGGESIVTISRRGFITLPRGPVEREPDRMPLVIDWDEYDRNRDFAYPR